MRTKLITIIAILLLCGCSSDLEVAYVMPGDVVDRTTLVLTRDIIVDVNEASTVEGLGVQGDVIDDIVERLNRLPVGAWTGGE